jgi:putative DNA primase/helicase
VRKSEFLAELASFNWAAREAHIIFDSDILEKPGVQQAEKRLADELMSRGAVVRQVRLPDSATGAKIGVDDFLISHTAHDLVDLVRNTPISEGGYEPPMKLSELLDTVYADNEEQRQRAGREPWT